MARTHVPLAGAVAGLLVAAVPVVAHGAPERLVVSAYAGTGDFHNTGDGGPAVKAGLDGLGAIATGPDGTVYVVADLRVRAIAPNGTITTVAGTGVGGFSGDGGPATRARFGDGEYASDDMHGLAVGPNGTVYVADTANNRIRAVNPRTHVITTVAGSGPNGKYGTFGGDGGPATSARLNEPQDVAVGSDGTLYIADTYNYRVRTVNARTHVIRTIAGGGDPDSSSTEATAAHVEPDSLAVGADGTVYFSEGDDERVRMVRDGRLTTLVGEGGQVGLHQLVNPSGLAVSGGVLYILDDLGEFSQNGVVYAVRLGGHPSIRWYVGGGSHSVGRTPVAASAAAIDSNGADLAAGPDTLYLTWGLSRVLAVRMAAASPTPTSHRPVAAHRRHSAGFPWYTAGLGAVVVAAGLAAWLWYRRRAAA